MRFETSNSTPPHLNRRLQLRMLGFVGLIGVIMFTMSTLQSNPQKNGKANRPFPGSPEPAVFKVEDTDRPSLKDDEFIVQPEGQPGNPNRGWKEPPPDGQESPVAARNELDREIAVLETTFDKGMLRRVKDNTLGIRREESDVYFRLLNHARRVSATELEKAGATDILYINLMTDPELYRGKAITIQGELWRLYEFQAGPNDWGLETLYEAWIFTPDSDKHPFRVVLSRLPRELEPGINLRKPVRVTGYFFKREGYASNGGMHVAPTLLAQRVIPYRSPDAAPSTDAIVPYMIGLISAVGLAFLVTLVSFAISDRRAARVAMLRELNAPRPSFEGIDAPDMVSVGESLRLLEEQQWHAATGVSPHDDAAAALHARDRASEHSNNPPDATRATDDELAERRRGQARVVRSWTANQQASVENGSSNDAVLNSNRGHRDTDRVRSRPVPESGAEPPIPATDAVTDLNGHERIADTPAVGNGLSKLAAWQNEIQQMSGQNHDEPLTAEQKLAQAELDRDQAARELELNDRLRHQRAELDHERAAREIRERDLEQSRRREQAQDRDELDASDLTVGHVSIDRADRLPEVIEDDVPDTSDEGEADESKSSRMSYDQGRRRRRRRDSR